MKRKPTFGEYDIKCFDDEVKQMSKFTPSSNHSEASSLKSKEVRMHPDFSNYISKDDIEFKKIMMYNHDSENNSIKSFESSSIDRNYSTIKPNNKQKMTNNKPKKNELEIKSNKYECTLTSESSDYDIMWASLKERSCDKANIKHKYEKYLSNKRSQSKNQQDSRNSKSIQKQTYLNCSKGSPCKPSSTQISPVKLQNCKSPIKENNLTNEYQSTGIRDSSKSKSKNNLQKNQIHKNLANFKNKFNSSAHKKSAMNSTTIHLYRGNKPMTHLSREDSTEVIKSIASSLKSKVLKIESKSPSRAFLSNHLSNTCNSSKRNILTPGMLSLRNSKPSVFSNFINKQLTAEKDHKGERIK